jgi:hypothetical protein
VIVTDISPGVFVLMVIVHWASMESLPLLLEYYSVCEACVPVVVVMYDACG